MSIMSPAERQAFLMTQVAARGTVRTDNEGAIKAYTDFSGMKSETKADGSLHSQGFVSDLHELWRARGLNRRTVSRSPLIYRYGLHKQ